MTWVDANVAGKITTLEAETWQGLIALIVEFVRKHPDHQIAWGDLCWDAR